MKYIIRGYIVLLSSTIAVSEQCLDPLTISDAAKLDIAKLSLEVQNKAEVNGSYIFFGVYIYTLSKSPLVQYALLGTDYQTLALQLKEPYEPNSAKTIVNTAYGTLRFGEFKDVTLHKSEFLNNYGTSKRNAFREMKEQCELFLLQKNMEKNMCYLVIIGVVILVYVLYTVSNFVLNFGTLRKIWKGSSATASLFNSLSQALTSRKISKHYQMATEKLYVDVYTKMNALENKIKAMEESAKLNDKITKNNTLEYDYVFCEGKNLLNTKSDYLTPVNTYITIEKVAN